MTLQKNEFEPTRLDSEGENDTGLFTSKYIYDFSSPLQYQNNCFSKLVRFITRAHVSTQIVFPFDFFLILNKFCKFVCKRIYKYTVYFFIILRLLVSLPKGC